MATVPVIYLFLISIILLAMGAVLLYQASRITDPPSVRTLRQQGWALIVVGGLLFILSLFGFWYGRRR